ncbi:MAG: hypothetical protein RIC55_12945 [Pirellulaceae bacterium]
MVARTTSRLLGRKAEGSTTGAGGMGAMSSPAADGALPPASQPQLTSQPQAFAAQPQALAAHPQASAQPQGLQQDDLQQRPPKMRPSRPPQPLWQQLLQPLLQPLSQPQAFAPQPASQPQAAAAHPLAAQPPQEPQPLLQQLFLQQRRAQMRSSRLGRQHFDLQQLPQPLPQALPQGSQPQPA